jgi:UPF0176 protein
MSAVMTFYRFVDLADLPALQRALAGEAQALGLCGTVLLAEEGINGTLAGEQAALEAFREHLYARPAFAGMECKFSAAEAGNPVFHRLKVLIKPEIVALKKPGLRPAEVTGEHVDWVGWNALLDDPDVVVIDTRNAYEIAVGTFPRAADPGTRSFRQWPDYVQRALDPTVHRRVAMFCTGGIRCEKASAYLLQQGFEQVYQLDGGILKYLETVPDAENRWIGECYVFDQRVSVDNELGEGTYEQCDACGRPVTEADRASPDYEPGLSCPQCAATQTPAQRAAFAERRRQQELAARRGARHVGAVPAKTRERADTAR